MSQRPISPDESSAAPAEQARPCATDNPLASIAAAVAAWRDPRGNVSQAGILITLDDTAAESLAAWGFSVASGAAWHQLHGADWQQLTELCGWSGTNPLEPAAPTPETTTMTTSDGKLANPSAVQTTTDATTEVVAEQATPNGEPCSPPDATLPEAMPTADAVVAETSSLDTNLATITTHGDASPAPLPVEVQATPLLDDALITDAAEVEAPTVTGVDTRPAGQPDVGAPPSCDAILVGWSPQNLSTEHPALLRSTVRRLRQFEQHLGADISRIAVWRPDQVDLERIKFYLECGSFADVRRAVQASLDHSRYDLDAVPLDDATSTNAADEHLATLRRAQAAALNPDCTEAERSEAEQDLAASCEQIFVAPLRTAALAETNEWRRNCAAMAAETAAEHYRTSSRLTATPNTAAERQKHTAGLLRCAALFCKLAREFRS